MKRLFLTFVILLGSRAFADLHPGEISNVQVAATATTATFTWDTAHASDSWVFLNFYDGSGMPARKVGQSGTVTRHSVVVSDLQPYNENPTKDVGQYQFYIASKQPNGTWSSFGGPLTNAYTKVLTFKTAPLDRTARLRWTMQPYGQKNVYAGHDLYLSAATLLLAGDGGGIAVMTSAKVRRLSDDHLVPSFRVEVLESLKSYEGGFNPGKTFDGTIFKFTSGTLAGKQFFYRPAVADVPAPAAGMGSDGGALRVHVPPNVAEGDYILTVTFQAFSNEAANTPAGSPISFDWPFHVYPPARFTPKPPTQYPPIPSLSTWQSTMTSNERGGGEFWCTAPGVVNPTASVEYGPFAGPIYAMEGSFNYNYFQPWNYDGGRVYLQIADYQYNTPGMRGYHSAAARDHWNHCAQSILYPYDNWLTRSYGNGLTEPNQFLLGTGMYYARTGDPTAATALAQTTGVNGNFRGIYGTMDTRGVRISAYTWMSQIANEASGMQGPWQLSGMATDVALANLDMFQQYTGTSVQPEWNSHNFQLGLLMESLIAQCELDKEKSRPCDPRIPVEIGKALYHLFDNFYIAEIGTTRFNLIDVPMSHAWNDANSTDIYSGLSLLIAPAAAWYWAQTGDERMRGYADAMFASAWKDTGDNNWGAKEFNQLYKWSFDFVRYRSGPDAKATFLPSQNPKQGAWPDTAPPLIVHEIPCGAGLRSLCQEGHLPAPVVNGTKVRFAWDTIKPATTEVFYKTGDVNACTMKQGQYQKSVQSCLSQYNGHFVADPSGVRHHAAIVTLAPNTKYHYALYSQDATGNGVMTPDATFATAPEASH